MSEQLWKIVMQPLKYRMSGDYWLLAGRAGWHPEYLVSTHLAEAQVYGQVTVMQQMAGWFRSTANPVCS